MSSRKFILFLLLLCSFQQLRAQFELKVSPIPLLFGVVAVSAEGATSESFGIDGDIIAGKGAFLANLSGKYYFNPHRGIDGFHIGVFTGFISDETEGIGVGFLAGTKLVSQKNLLFEAGLGVGRSFNEGGIFYAKLHMGYRFNKKEAAK